MHHIDARHFTDPVLHCPLSLGLGDENVKLHTADGGAGFGKSIDLLFRLFETSPVGSIPSLSLEPESGAATAASARPWPEVASTRTACPASWSSACPKTWPLVLAVDASTWDRCDAECSPERGSYYSASKHSAGQRIAADWSTSGSASSTRHPKAGAHRWTSCASGPIATRRGRRWARSAA